jgi:uncharacterized protein YdcH (DUF465 family)
MEKMLKDLFEGFKSFSTEMNEFRSEMNEFRSEVNGKFIQIDERFAQIDERLGRIEENQHTTLQQVVRNSEEIPNTGNRVYKAIPRLPSSLCYLYN